MSDNHRKVEGETDLVRDMNSHAIINRNKGHMNWLRKGQRMQRENYWKKKNKEIQLETQPER